MDLQPGRVSGTSDPFQLLGDEIEIEGWYYPYMKSRVVATRVTIRGARPLGEEPKPKRKVAPKTPPAKPSDEELPF